MNTPCSRNSDGHQADEKRRPLVWHQHGRHQHTEYAKQHFHGCRNIRFRNITATNDEYGLTGPMCDACYKTLSVTSG